MKRADFDRRRARGGKGLIPPNPNQWDNEHNGLDLREELGLGLDVPLPVDAVFDLLPNVDVVGHGELPAAQTFIDHFRDGGRQGWSGMALPLGGDEVIIVYNDSHPTTRRRATLMEEFFHLWLGHPPSTVRVYAGDSGYRSHNAAVENAAYGSGAAALVPYFSLRSAAERGWSISQIATTFQVSPQLVAFRAKVTKQYNLLRGKKREPRS